MPTNRPFLANFLAAFRAHSALQNASTTTSVSTVTASPSTASTFSTSSSHQNTTSTSTTTSTTARAITTKTTPSVGATTAAVAAATASSHLSHHHPHHRHPTTTSPIPTPHNPAFGPRNRQRRGSDSSSEGGFRDALGNEKWYIGGRTAGGEERFYRLGMVRRERSGDRRSVDRLSL